MSQAPLYDLDLPDTSIGLQAALWQQSLQDYVSNDPRFGTRIQIDCLTPVSHVDSAAVGERALDSPFFMQEAAVNGAGSASIITGNDPNGVWNFASGLTTAHDTDHQGAEYHYGVTATGVGIIATPNHATLASQRVVFQTRCDVDDVGVLFLGLTEPIVDFLSATSTLPANSDFIGFFRSDSGDLLFHSFNDNNGGTAVADNATLIANADLPTGQVNFGFAINVDNTVDIVVNGQNFRAEAASINPLSIPIELLTWKLATTIGTTSDATTITVPVESIDVFSQRTG